MNDDEDKFDKRLTSALLRTAELDYCAGLPPVEELDRLVIPSKGFRRRMAKMLKNPIVYIRNQKRPPYLRALRAAAMIVLVLSVLLGAAMLNPTARAYIIRVVRTVFSGYNTYTYSEKTGKSIRTDWEFGYIPEGFELVVQDITVDRSYYEYENVDKAYFIILIGGDSGTIYLDNEHTDFYQLEIQGETADIYKALDGYKMNSIVWYREAHDVIILIVGMLDINECIYIAENIK